MIIKKKHPNFNIPNYGLKSRKRVMERWRKQRGDDSKKRVKRQGFGANPSIGYKNPDATRFARRDGIREMLVHNEKELLAVPRNTEYVAVFAHDLSARKRKSFQKIADANGVKISNRVSV